MKIGPGVGLTSSAELRERARLTEIPNSCHSSIYISLFHNPSNEPQKMATTLPSRNRVEPGSINIPLGKLPATATSTLENPTKV